jgi:RimJ/RimL family protein N-acetyltransferase
MMHYLIPTNLETERLILRPFREDDWASLHEYFSDETCMRYTNGHPFTKDESRLKLKNLMDHWDIHKYGSYALEEKESKKLVGIAGLDYPPDWPEPEIQWGLLQKFWGKGYASEEVREIKKMTAHYLPQLSLISLIHPHNTNSANLAKAVGAKYEKEYAFRGDTWWIFRH